MNTAKILDFIKTHLVSLLCGVVAIVSIVAIFWPVGKWFTDLQSTADQHAGLYGTLDGLLHKQRKLPLTDPSKTQQDDLTVFPNKKTIDKGSEVTKEVGDQSMAMVALVDNLNQKPHVLLVADALPAPMSDTPRFRFGDLYKLVLSNDPAVSMTTDKNLKDAAQPNLINDILHGGLPPTEQQMKDRSDAIWQSDFAPRIIMQNGAAINQAEVQGEYTDRVSRLADEMKYDIASGKKVYVAADAFAVNPNVVGVQAPNPVDIWNAQQILWLQTDISNAIAEANASSANILDAPVKHLIKLLIPQTIYAMPSAAAAGPGGGAAVPAAPVEGADTATLPKDTASSPTGRVSNPLYDVIRFTLVVYVDAQRIPMFLSTLTHNRLIDVYNMDVYTVNLDDARAHGFLYGRNPVVQLNLHCEALYMRKWTAPLMPLLIKQQLGVAVAAAPAAGT